MYERKWVFATNYDFLISLSLQTDEKTFFQTINSVVRLNSPRLTGCTDIGIRKLSYSENLIPSNVTALHEIKQPMIMIAWIFLKIKWGLNYD